MLLKNKKRNRQRQSEKLRSGDRCKIRRWHEVCRTADNAPNRFVKKLNVPTTAYRFVPYASYKGDNIGDADAGKLDRSEAISRYTIVSGE